MHCGGIKALKAKEGPQFLCEGFKPAVCQAVGEEDQQKAGSWRC